MTGVTAAADKYNRLVVFHGAGYSVYNPQRCRPSRVISAQFDLSTRRSTRLQLTSGLGHVTAGGGRSLCDVTCDWTDAVVVNNEFIFVSEASFKRVIVINIRDSHSPVEVGHVTSSRDPVLKTY